MSNWDHVAVLTGDLIGSTRAEAAATELAISDLRQAASDIAGWIGADTRFTRFRGDGWQIALTNHSNLALRGAIYLIARLKARKGGVQTRISVATGTVDDMGTRDLSDARGDAFTQSGRRLDRMRQGSLCAHFDGMKMIHLGFMDLLEPLLARWTPEQAEAVSHGLPPKAPTQKEIARLLDISDQAVSYRFRGANADALYDAIKSWEADMKPGEQH